MVRALLLSVALGACAAPTPHAPSQASALHQPRSVEAARAAGVDFRGVGQEPGWVLDIGRELDLIYDYGEHRVRLPAWAPAYPQEGATRYSAQGGGHALAVTIQRFPCQDAMSGEAYPARVTVVVDGRTLQGCGRTL